MDPAEQAPVHNGPDDGGHDRDEIRRWVQSWRDAAPDLEKIRRDEVRDADNLAVLHALERTFRHAQTLPLRRSSGMIGMRRLFSRLSATPRDPGSK